MSVISINGSMPNQVDGFIRAVKIIYDTLNELGVEIDEVNLSECRIPYFNYSSAKNNPVNKSPKKNQIEDIMMRAEKAKGIIFLSSSAGFAPSALMQTFLEYFEINGASVLNEKNCMVFAVVRNGERAVLDYFSRFLNHYGAFDLIKVVINTATLNDILSGGDSRSIFEKYVEDYYRLMRQGRKFFIPLERSYTQQMKQPPLAALTPEEAGVLAEVERRKKIPASEIYKKLDLDSFTKQQEADINDLTQYFAGKSTDSEPHKKISEYEDFLLPKSMSKLQTPAAPTPKQNLTPRTKTCKQMTQSLPHYFQPQLAVDLITVIQLQISGSEKFDGYFSIANNECEYYDGIAAAPDVTIVADSGIWMDIISNKYTAQKAFMIGQLKVRGNFVILTKFDQVFKLP